ncbi:MAG: prepilin-type N-terminal cleavage/methylation domain-containing protein [Candidatus Hinthialibacter antarcticus]|nr:prepilin-type N-terminal cleavage/methylation domain-containing protein [Candidatus Hinthialibacter antarcticus]
MTKRQHVSAFTLIELLIVVAIIGILAAIAVPNFMNARVRATIARVQGDIKALSTAVEMYALDHGAYPDDGQVTGIPWWMNNRLLTTPISYIGTIPKDPFLNNSEAGDSTNGHREYWYVSYDGYGVLRSTGRPQSVGGRSNVRLFDPPRQSFRFGFISPGTDGCWEWDRGNGWCGPEFYAGDVLYYESTNGVISRGDLYHFGPGSVYNPPSSFSGGSSGGGSGL